MLVQLCLYAVVVSVVFGANEGPIDLTYELENDKIPMMPNTNYRMDVMINNTVSPSQTEKLNMSTNVGTHVEAPCRYVTGKSCISDIKIEKLQGRLHIMNFEGQKPDIPITAQQVKDWEKSNGAIKQKSIVIINTGWGVNWSNITKYTGTNSTTNLTNMHFPGLAKDAAEELVKRSIVGIGIDTLSMDYGQSNGSFDAHKAFANADIYTILNVANIKGSTLNNPKNSTAYVMPINLKKAGAAPCRFFALQNGVSGLFSKSAMSVLIGVCLAVSTYFT